MKIICDDCENYEVSLDGCFEKCWADIESEYKEERMSGNKNICKGFQKLPEFKKINIL